MRSSGSLFTDLPDAPLEGERFEDLYSAPGVRIERIVSTGQAQVDWCDEPQDEWVAVLKGRAGLEIEGEAVVRVLEPGDWALLPAHRRHRVAWTENGEPTVWLAVHVRT